MFSSLRRALLGFNRDEQEAYLTAQIYRLSKWLEQIDQAEHADRRGGKTNPAHRDATELLARFDEAKARLAAGALPRAEFTQLRARLSDLERAMDVELD